MWQSSENYGSFLTITTTTHDDDNIWHHESRYITDVRFRDLLMSGAEQHGRKTLEPETLGCNFSSTVAKLRFPGIFLSKKNMDFRMS